ncbi:MAG: hypothetical protein QNJ72_38795 [Pleurocapsa sp. MO_226.B13]|nr:hypothetical protein [Pleurocapsa sp. MO_226.B13]
MTQALDSILQDWADLNREEDLLVTSYYPEEKLEAIKAKLDKMMIKEL